MRYLIVLSIAVISFSAFGEVKGLFCANGVTQFRATTNDKIVTVQVRHLRGSEFTAFYTSPVVGVTVPKIIKSNDVVNSLGNNVELSWSIENCKQQDILISCSIGNDTVVNGYDLKPLQFRSDVVRTTNLDQDYSTININMSFIIDQGIYRFAGVFKPNECRSF